MLAEDEECFFTKPFESVEEETEAVSAASHSLVKTDRKSTEKPCRCK